MTTRDAQADLFRHNVGRAGWHAGMLDQCAADVESLTAEEAVEILFRLRAAVETMRRVDAALEVWIAKVFRELGHPPKTPVEFPEGMVEVKRSRDRKEWQHEALRSKWLNVWLDVWLEEHGGELPSAAEVRDALLDCVSVSAWKVTGLRKLSIDSDDYCTSLPGTARVVITSAD